MWKFNSSENWEGNHSNHRNPKHGQVSHWHEKRGCQTRHAVIWPWWVDCNCMHLCLESVSGHPLGVSRPAMSLWPESLPAIFANGSSLRDLWSRDTGQLEKRKHKSLELPWERFTVYRGALFEIESLIRKCWWSDPVEVVHTMSGSLRCHLTGGLITSSLVPRPCAVTDMSSLFVHCGVSSISIGRCNKWVTVRYMAWWQSFLSTECLILLPPPPPTPLQTGSKTGNTCSHVPGLLERGVLEHRERIYDWR